MLTSEQIEIISEAIVPLFDYLEQEVISDIARRIAKTLTYTRTAELMVMDMKRLGYSPLKIKRECIRLLQKDKEFQKAVEKNTIEYKKEVKEKIAEIVAKAKAEGNELVANSGTMSWIDDLSVWNSNGVDLKENPRLKTLVKAMQMQSRDAIINLTNSTGFKMMGGFESVESLYRMELNKAVIKLASGAFSQEKIVTDIIHNLAQSGLRSIDYASGKSMQLDSAVRIAIRTGAHQLSGQIQKINIEETGVNLIYVEEHENARNVGSGIRNHEQWQGKVYYIEGSPDQYAEEAKRIGQSSIEDLWEKTGYSIDGKHENNPLGLYGYNCLHITYPWWQGVSVLPERIKPTEPVEYKGRTLDGYAQTQEMRRQERAIRNLKREKEALERLGQPTDEIRAKIREKTKEYHEFCGLCGAPKSTVRLRYESGTSDYTKTEAYKDYLRQLKSSSE